MDVHVDHALLNVPPAESAYLDQVVHVLQQHLQQRLVGVYLFGSAAYGEYEAGISDLDVQAVVTEALSTSVPHTIAAALTHKRLACPARRLELVIYAQREIDPASRRPQFEMNFNTGAGEPDHFSTDPGQEASHWFLLDIAMGRALGRSLLGPAPSRVFAPILRLWCLEAIADSLAWHHAHESTSANNVLNACRGWRYAATDSWGSKRAGAVWARQQLDCLPVVAQAEQLRRDGAPLNPSAVAELVALVADAVRTVLRRERHEQTDAPAAADLPSAG